MNPVTACHDSLHNGTVSFKGVQGLLHGARDLRADVQSPLVTGLNLPAEHSSLIKENVPILLSLRYEDPRAAKKVEVFPKRLELSTKDFEVSTKTLQIASKLDALLRVPRQSLYWEVLYCNQAKCFAFEVVNSFESMCLCRSIAGLLFASYSTFDCISWNCLLSRLLAFRAWNESQFVSDFSSFLLFHFCQHLHMNMLQIVFCNAL